MNTAANLNLVVSPPPSSIARTTTNRTINKNTTINDEEHHSTANLTSTNTPSITTTTSNQNKLKLMPTPPAMPIIGHIHLLRDHQHNPWDGFDLIRKEFGNVVSLKMGIHPMVLVSSFEAITEILTKKRDIFLNRPNFARHHIIFGGDKENSLALCNWSETHKHRRKLCREGILPNKLSRVQLLEKIITTKVINFIKNIESSCIPIDDSASEVYHIMTKENLLFLTSDIFMDFLCNEKHPHEKDYKEFNFGCDFVFWDINQSYLIDFLPYLTSFGVAYFYLRKLKRVTDFLRTYIDDKIFEPRLKKHLLCSDESNMEPDSIEGDYLDSLIEKYLAKKNPMTLVDYRVGFADLLAGHAAVANILIRLLGHLALDEKIQDMIYEEAKNIDISNLNYKPSLPITEAAMQEALRIASSPIVPHVAREDTSIGDFFVPEGTMVLFNIHHLNLSEHLWTRPYEFDPTRFLTTCDNGGKLLHIPKYFIPFSTGMRKCLGQKMVESTTIVMTANICRRFRIKATDEMLVKKLLTPKGSIALNPEAECYDLKLYPR